MPQENPEDHEERRRRLMISAAAYVLQAAALASVLYATDTYWSQPYHTSTLSGYAWLQELIHGHPDRIHHELGVRLHVFLQLIGELRLIGYENSCYVTLEEQVAIFLYTCVTGLSARHVGERFQRSNDTITKYDSLTSQYSIYSYSTGISARF